MTGTCHCPKSRSNNRLRVHIDEFISMIPAGENFGTQHLARELQKTHKSLRMSPQRASCLIRDRADVKWIGDGKWMKVPEDKQIDTPEGRKLIKEAHEWAKKTLHINAESSEKMGSSQTPASEDASRSDKVLEEISHYTGCASHSAAKSGAVLDELEKKMIEDIYLMHFTSRREGIEAVPVYAAINIVRQRIGEIK